MTTPVEQFIPDIDTRQLAMLAEMCGYLPLALRVLGRRAGTRPLGSLVGELRARLTSPGAVRDPVQVVLDLVYESLPSEACGVLRLLGVRAGESFCAHQVALWADIPAAEADKQLRVLMEMRLVREIRPGTYGMHDLVKVYACERARSEGPESP